MEYIYATETEGLYSLLEYTWDVRLEILIGFEPADRSCGVRGGPYIASHHIAQYIFNYGEQYLSVAEMGAKYRNVKLLVDNAVDQWINDNHDRLLEEGCEEASNFVESQEDDYYDNLRDQMRCES